MRMIWAQARNGVIGDGETIPWHLPEDLQHFKSHTQNGTVIMGRRTWESLPESVRPLPRRRNIVCSQSTDFQPEGAELARDLEQARKMAGDDAWVMGGGELYRQLLPYATICLVTEIDSDVPGSVRGPVLDDQWRLDEATRWMRSERGSTTQDEKPVTYRFLRYVRVRK